MQCGQDLKTLPRDETWGSAEGRQRLRACPMIPVEGGQLSCKSDQPIYLRASLAERTFLDTVPAIIKTSVVFLHPDFWSLIGERTELTSWMKRVLGVDTFNQPNYCKDIVNRLNRDCADVDELVITSATRFLARSCDSTVNIDDIPVVLSDGRRLLLSTL